MSSLACIQLSWWEQTLAGPPAVKSPACCGIEGWLNEGMKCLLISEAGA